MSKSMFMFVYFFEFFAINFKNVYLFVLKVFFLERRGRGQFVYTLIAK